MEKGQKNSRKVRFSTMQVIALGFLGVILLGAVLLSLPVCNQKPIAFLDALFTSVTSVCVTGLVTIVPAEQFTLLGKIVLLALIQFGGLGVIACTVAFFLLLGKRISMKGRVMIQQAYGLDTLSGMVLFMLRIFKGTFLVEGIGALLFAVQFVPEYGVAKGIGYAVFHSVSAFCNAGIDLLGDSSLIKYAVNPLVNLTVMFLIVLSGLGFPVWHDVYVTGSKVLREKLPLKRMFTRLSLHSKITLSMTGILILTGMAGIFFLECNNPETLGQMRVPEKLMGAAFQSITTRTAGFATFSQAALRKSSQLLCCVLMLIGGSPSGTAGGMKTTTVAMLFLTVYSVLKGRRNTECFGRKLNDMVVRTGISIVMISFFIWLVGLGALLILEPGADPMAVAYEVTSAVGTVGLTADLTPHLSRISQGVLMLLMYCGRIGPMTMALVFMGRGTKSERFRELPEGKVLIG